jgi:hypothetical protein
MSCCICLRCCSTSGMVHSCFALMGNGCEAPVARTILYGQSISITINTRGNAMLTAKGTFVEPSNSRSKTT